MITSTDNIQVKYLRHLLIDRRFRHKNQRFVIEGVHLLQTALLSKSLPEKVFVPESRVENVEIQACLQQIPEQSVVVISDKVAKQIASLSNGCDVFSQMILPHSNALPNGIDCVVLENVQDPGNVGTILRTTAATGISHIVLDSQCADVWSPKVLRSAMGAHFLLKIATNVRLIYLLRKFSGRVHVTTLTTSWIKNLHEVDLTHNCAWVFGNEGTGVSPEIATCAPFGVRIPMIGKTESLNVAMAASVCLFEQMRQRHYVKA
ncbi:MAG: RNA methyltransferase [Neisseriaceae bacterium]|nr:RNA methyltransferase [Neisseriaceae bacterium]